MKAIPSAVLMLLLALVTPLAAKAASGKAHAIAHLAGSAGQALGTAQFTTTSHGVLIELDLKGLPPGGHAIHIHTSGNCDAKVAFTSSGPDLSFDAAKLHGFLAPHGPHAGDLPNEFAAADGTLHASVISNAISLGNGKKSIFDRDGAAIAVHARADDYTSQPNGNAGDRIACGVIERISGPATRKGGRRKTHK